MPNKTINICGLSLRLNHNGRSKTDFIKGIETITISEAIITAAIVIKVVSLKNWNCNCLRLLPRTFRILTSFALLTACAVERFIKFTHAISKINSAIILSVLISSFEIVLFRKLPLAAS